MAYDSEYIGALKVDKTFPSIRKNFPLAETLGRTALS